MFLVLAVLLVGGVMFKVYVVGHIIKVVYRASLSDISGDQTSETGVMPFPRVSSATASVAGINLDTAVTGKSSNALLKLKKNQNECIS